MEKYLLISVFEREIYAELFNSFEDAQNKMQEEFNAHVRESQLGDIFEDNECYLGLNYAWITDGVNHDNYDWRINKININIKTDIDYLFSVSAEKDF
jgi:hypothetical protein